MDIPRSALAFLVLAVTPVAVQAQLPKEASGPAQAQAPAAEIRELELPEAESPDVTLSSQLDRFIDEHRTDKAGLTAAFRFMTSRTDEFPDSLYSKLLEYVHNFDPTEAGRMGRVCAFHRIESINDPARRAAVIGEFLEKYPTDAHAPDAAAERFQIMRELHDLDGVESAFRQRSSVDADSPDTYAAMAATYIERHTNLEDAQNLLQKAESLLRSSDAANSRVSYFLVLSPDPARAESDIAYWQAQAFLLQKDPKHAVEKAEKALVSRQDSEAWYTAGQAWQAAGKISKALQAYMEAVCRSSTRHVQQMAELEKLWLGGRFGNREQLQQRLRAIEQRNFQAQDYVPTFTDRLARDFAFTTINGEKLTAEDLRTKTVVLYVWAPWCESSLPELPELQELQQQHPEMVIAALALNSDPETLARIMQDEKLDSLRIVTDSAHAHDFTAAGVPAAYIIDHGRVRISHTEALNHVTSYLEADLAALHSERAQNIEQIDLR